MAGQESRAHEPVLDGWEDCRMGLVRGQVPFTNERLEAQSREEACPEATGLPFIAP